MQKIQNVIVAMFDSLQYNYLACNGNSWIKTPNFDRFAREGVVFDNCYTEGLPTVPCRRAMHTGRYTLPFAGWVPLTMEDTTIADLCWGRPIDTALVFDCPMYRLTKFGYTRGFDKVWFLHGHEADHEYFAQDTQYHYKAMDFIEQSTLDNIASNGQVISVDNTVYELECYLKDTQYWKSEEDQRAVKVLRKAGEYLDQVDRNKQFYLWVDCFDPHEPWDPPSVYDPELKCPYDPDYTGKDEHLPFSCGTEGIYTEEQEHHIRMLYAEKVTLCDKYFGELMDKVRTLGLEENTLVMLVSDHGEPFGRGEHGHGIIRKGRPWPYEELVHAVMMMRGPGLPAGTRSQAYVQSCDVAPTVCDWLGIGVHPDMQGKSLLALAAGKVEKVRDFAIAGYYKYSWSMINDEWSYIHWPKKSKVEDRTAAGDIYGFDKSGRHGREYITSEALDRHKAAASLDGEDQWTCTPGSAVDVPESDELYNRKNDKAQLQNVIKQHPEIAQSMLKTIKEFMSELRAS